MLYSRPIVFSTGYSKGVVLEKLRASIDNESRRNERSFYKGRFSDEGFIILKKGSNNYTSEVVIYGRFESEPEGTKIVADIKFTRIAKVIFWFFNGILIVQLIRSLMDSKINWIVPGAILVAVWLIATIIMCINHIWFRRMLSSIFSSHASKSVKKNEIKSVL